MKNLLAATALLTLPFAANAATFTSNIDLTQAGYSFALSDVAAGEDALFTFTFTDAARVSGISLSGSGTNRGADIGTVTYTVTNPNAGPEGFQSITQSFGVGSGSSVIPGTTYAAGSVLTVLYENAAANPTSYTVSFPVAAVPVPAAGLLLLTALGGAAAMRRRKKA